MEEENIQTPEEGTEQEGITPEEQPQAIEEDALEKSTGSEAVETEPEQKPSESAVDYKKKFSSSAAENQILLNKIKKLESRLGFVTSDETPTEQELRAEFPDWDNMMDLEKKLATKQLILERRLAKAALTVQEMAEEKRWNEEFERFLEKNEILNRFPGLKGKEKEFKEYAKKPTHKGIDLEVLARAFLYNPEAEPAKETHKEKVSTKPVLETGSGGRGQPPTPEMTPEDIKLLRQNDPKLYNLYVKQGKIKIE